MLAVNSVQILLSSSLLSKSKKIKMYITVIVSVVCVSVKPGLSHGRRIMGSACSRICY